MKIFIPSSGRADIISTHKLLEKEYIDYTIVVHNDEELSYYEKNRSIPQGRLLNVNVPKGVSNIRNAILERVEEGEWLLMLDDNIKEFSAVPMPEYHELIADWERDRRKLFQTPASSRDFIKICDEMIAYNERWEKNNPEGYTVNLMGFATTDNHFFREKKYRFIGFVVGKAMIIRKTALRFNPNIQTMDDYEFTAKNLKEFGAVTVNNWAFVKKKHYQTGGIGSYDERIGKKKADVQKLLTDYPGLFRINNKRKGAKDSEVLIRFNNRDQVDKWRRELENRDKH